MRIYINGVEATNEDLAELRKRCKAGNEKIVSVEFTKKGNVSIKTL